MEWIRISSNKLKIMLTAEDARRYALNCESADYADRMTRTAFREILTDVRQQTGFDATEDKVYIQMYPSKEGGCELFVTKMGLLLEGDGDQGHPPDASLRHTASPNARREPSLVSVALVFERLEPLLLLCRRLRAEKRVRRSEAFRDDLGRWWLLLRATGKGLSYLAEYAAEQDADAARLFLGEHGRAVCESMAVETLGKL